MTGIQKLKISSVTLHGVASQENKIIMTMHNNVIEPVCHTLDNPDLMLFVTEQAMELWAIC